MTKLRSVSKHEESRKKFLINLRSLDKDLESLKVNFPHLKQGFAQTQARYTLDITVACNEAQKVEKELAQFELEEQCTAAISEAPNHKPPTVVHAEVNPLAVAPVAVREDAVPKTKEEAPCCLSPRHWDPPCHPIAFYLTVFMSMPFY